MMKVAFLGLGTMGRPMATNLVRAGHDVTVWNRTPGKFVPGARLAASPAEAARRCDVVWICVADTNAVENVLFGRSGVASVATPGMIVVDSSTISPKASSKFAHRLIREGVDFVDAPVSGSRVAAETAQLVFIVGGKESAIAKLTPLFDAMGRKSVRMGDAGMGESAKLSINLMIAMIYEGFAEAITLVRRLGVAEEKFLDLVASSVVRSGVSDMKTAQLKSRDFTPQFPVRLMHKDLELTLDTAREVGTVLPGVEEIEKLYRCAIESGLRDQDYSSTVQVLEELARMEEERIAS